MGQGFDSCAGCGVVGVVGVTARTRFIKSQISALEKVPQYCVYETIHI